LVTADDLSSTAKAAEDAPIHASVVCDAAAATAAKEATVLREEAPAEGRDRVPVNGEMAAVEERRGSLRAARAARAAAEAETRAAAGVASATSVVLTLTARPSVRVAKGLETSLAEARCRDDRTQSRP
jgi:hypothetical protein